MQSNIQFFVAQLPQLLPAGWSDGNEPTLAVVIDTLRFTSTACVALAAGATLVCVAAEVETARQLANQLGGSALLCGERHCHRIEGFQLGNSPFEYTASVVAERDLVFSTTNGTRAVAAAAGAKQVLLASLMNRAAIVDWICKTAYQRIWILCAGTDGQIAAEDLLTAGAILSRYKSLGLPHVLANDSARIALHLFESLRNHSNSGTVNSGTVEEEAIVELLTQAAGGQNLIQSGYSPDIHAVSRLDALNVVPGNSAEQPERFAQVDIDR